MAKIFIVDDNIDIRTILTMALKKQGHEVSECENGLLCLEKLRGGEEPDLIILDVMMPEMDGWAVSRTIKTDAYMKDISICMLTAKSTDLDALMSVDYGKANWHLNKPISQKKLLETIDWLLEQRPRFPKKPAKEKRNIEGIKTKINPELMNHNYDFLNRSA